MRGKSNITIASNIYNRKNLETAKDIEFIHNCRGAVALGWLKRQLYGINGTIGLTDAQCEELAQDVGCSLAKDKQMTHGLVKRGQEILWECRCEYSSCPRFSECMPQPIVRVKCASSILPNDVHHSVDLKFKWLGTLEGIFDSSDGDVPSELDESLEEEPIESVISDIKSTFIDEFLKITNQSPIIESSMETRILVNAGPGTGKTHSVVERLVFIIDSGEVDLEQVLVLCYTNAARDVIVGRLEEKGFSAQVRQMVICTLDSLAWANLSQKTDCDLFKLGFNGCIQRFNEEFDPEEWTDFQYVIIDELQDLVNDRAKMVLKIVSALQCGYLLLGDRCQAVYDYDCKGFDKIDSVDFYRELNNILPLDTLKYEFLGNRRQSRELALSSDAMRMFLLERDAHEVNCYFDATIKKMGSFSFSPEQFVSMYSPHIKTAILTRTNAEAEWVSAKLYRKQMPHTLLRSVGSAPSFHRWMADMFWDYRESRISKSDFFERYLARVINNAQSAEEAYRAVIDLIYRGDRMEEFFSLDGLINALNRGQDASPLLLNESHDALTVSTIHKAKGREFDCVYLLAAFSPKNDNTEEARVWYVGATRPRSSLSVMTPLKVYTKKPTPMNRRIFTGRKFKSDYCQRLVVGLPGDVDSIGFVAGNLMDALDKQKYIANNIQINDPVDLIYDKKKYCIYHKNMNIGSLRPEVEDDFWHAVQMTDIKGRIPPRLTEVYVKNIFSVVASPFSSSVDPMFKESRFWLGVELTGFAKVDWHWGGV